MLPAHQGDCLWIEYGQPGQTQRILIDGGPPATYAEALRKRIEDIPGERRFELLVVTHVDTDHIGGILKLLDKPPQELRFDEVWFNAWQHIAPGLLGGLDGEILTKQLNRMGWPWNSSFSKAAGQAAVVPETGGLPTRTMPGGMRLTVLSPGAAQLKALQRDWLSVCRAAGLEPGTPAAKLKSIAARKGIKLLGDPRLPLQAWAAKTTTLDDTSANGSTIALLAEYEGKGCLFAGDGFSPVLAASIRRLPQMHPGKRLTLSALKLPHHGSARNVTSELLELVSCNRFLFSTNGAIFGHPDREAVARVILYGGPNPTLSFNYKTPFNELWAGKKVMADFSHRVEYGDAQEGLVVEL